MGCAVTDRIYGCLASIHRQSGGNPMQTVRTYFKSPASPYVTGAVFGLLSALSGMLGQTNAGRIGSRLCRPRD